MIWVLPWHRLLLCQHKARGVIYVLNLKRYSCLEPVPIRSATSKAIALHHVYTISMQSP